MSSPVKVDPVATMQSLQKQAGNRLTESPNKIPAPAADPTIPRYNDFRHSDVTAFKSHCMRFPIIDRTTIMLT